MHALRESSKLIFPRNRLFRILAMNLDMYAYLNNTKQACACVHQMTSDEGGREASHKSNPWRSRYASTQSMLFEVLSVYTPWMPHVHVRDQTLFGIQYLRAAHEVHEHAMNE